MDIYQRAIVDGFSLNSVAVNALLYMYVKCGRTQKVDKLFIKCRHSFVGVGNAQNGFSEKMLQTFKQMQLGVQPHYATFISATSACAAKGALHEGMEIHVKALLIKYLRRQIMLLIANIGLCSELNCLSILMRYL